MEIYLSIINYINKRFEEPEIYDEQMNKDDLKQFNFDITKNMNKLLLDKNKVIYLLLFKLIIMTLIIKSHAKKSYITLTLEGPGFQSIFFGNNIWDNCDQHPHFTPPDEIIINKVKQLDITYQYYFNETLNYVELIWNEDTQITSSSCLFYTCESITEIDLSNYDSSNNNNTYRMFRDCIKLTSINLTNFNTAKVENVEAMFKNCSLLKKLDLSSFDTSKITSMFRMFYACISLTSLDLSNFNTPYVTRMEEMFFDCKLLNHINLKNANFPEELSYIGAFDAAKNLVCCVNDGRLVEMINNYECAMVNCENNWIENQKKINTENDSCIDDCSLCNYKFEYDNFCYEQCPNGTVPNKNNKCYQFKLDEEIKDKDELVQNIQEFIDSGIDLSNLDQGNDIEIKEEGITIALTTTDNQKSNENKNKTVIDLKSCEERLKKVYNISKNSSLYILKIDVEQKGMKIPKIEYEFYFPLKGNELIKLNLTHCKDINIDLSIPTIINGSIDKYNSNSEYYNSICSKTSSESSFDIPLKDRKNEFIEKNLTLCEDNCNYVNYDYDNKKVKCSCEIKINLPIIKDVTIDTEKLKNSFTDIKNILNINIMRCSKIALKIENLKNNYGCFIILYIFILFFICLLAFYCKYFDQLKNLINSIVSAKLNMVKNNNQNQTKKEENNSNKKQKTKKTILDSQRIKMENKNKNITKVNKKFTKKKKCDNKKGDKLKKNKTNLKLENSENSKNKMDKKNKILSTIKENKIYKKYKQLLDYTDYELNSLNYKDALIYDKRAYSQYYFSLLKSNHLLIFTFCNNNDYNTKIIKIFLFFYSFAVHFTINALFFNDSTMHKIYEDSGSYNFIYQIPQIIYSSIISAFFNSIIKFLSLTNKNVISIKNEEDYKNLDKKVKKLFETLKVKFFLFFMIAFIILFVFWYYITCFCGIYTNTQIHLIKDSVVSFGLSFIYPLIILLLPGIFRIHALNAKKKNKKCLYGFSKFLALL